MLEVYGTTEASNIAFRLPEDRAWTTFEPRIIVEVLDSDGGHVRPGEVGEIVVSTLGEPTSPMLRYATGDLARVEAGSATGESGLRLDSLEGRLTDSIVGAGGQQVGFWTVAYSAFWASDAVAHHVDRWQVHQDADGSIAVSLELTPTGDLTTVTPAIVGHLTDRLGQIPVDVVATERVHDPTAGEFRSVTSDATSDPPQRTLLPEVSSRVPHG